MSRNRRAGIATALGATFATIALAGCTIGPLTLPDLPVSLPGISLEEGPTLEEARTAQRDARTPATHATIEEGVLTVGLRNTATSPMVCFDADGKVTGMDLEVAAALADQLGLDVRFVLVSNPQTSIGTECDVIMGVGASEGGSSVIVGDYAQVASGLFEKSFDADHATVSDLPGKNVAVVTGSASAAVLASSGIGVNQVACADAAEAISQLQQGTVSYALVDAYEGAYLVRNGSGNVTFAGTLDVPLSRGIAVASDNPDLQLAVQTAFSGIQNNGVLGIIRGKWLGGMSGLGADSQVGGMAELTASQQPAEGEGDAEGEADGADVDAEATDDAPVE